MFDRDEKREIRQYENFFMGKAFKYVVVLVALSGVGLLVARPFGMFREETRRLIYQESVTAQTACQANLARYYEEWTVADTEHRRALEVAARTEARRYRCQDLDPDLENWIRSIQR